MVGFIARKEMKVFHLYAQLCIYRDKEDGQHGRTGFMGQSWSHELSCMEFAGLWGSPWSRNQQALGNSAFWVENNLEK